MSCIDKPKHLAPILRIDDWMARSEGQLLAERCHSIWCSSVQDITATPATVASLWSRAAPRCRHGPTIWTPCAKARCCHCGHTAARHRPTTQPTTSRPPGRLFCACASKKCRVVATQSTSGCVPAKPWERGNKQGEKARNADLASARRYQKLWNRVRTRCIYLDKFIFIFINYFIYVQVS